MEKRIIPYGKQYIDDEDISSVIRVLKSDWLTQGPKVEEFETALANYCGAKHAIVMSSGTAALHIACRISDCAAYVGLTSPNTFVASANAFEYNKIKSRFVDISRLSWNMDADLIEEMITPQTKILIPVHFAGLPCDMERIKQLKDKYGLFVIEDACHALGATYKGSRIGSCKYSDITIFSFHPVKHISTGEGGCLLTNDDKLAARARIIRTHGITKDKLTYSNDPWYYEMHELGVNARITDIQCALGISQLKKLDMFVARRREIANRYRKEFLQLFGVSVQRWNYEATNSYHLFVIKLDCSIYDRRVAYDKLRERGIYCQIHYIPVYLQPYYRSKYNFAYRYCPNAEDYYKGCLSIPMYPAMTDDDVEYSIYNIKEVLHECRYKG